MMHGPDGTDYPNKITYIEMVKPERLVYAHGDDREDEQFRVTVTFAEKDGKTEQTMRMVFKSAKDRDFVIENFGALEGAQQTTDRLAEHLEAIQSEKG